MKRIHYVEPYLLDPQHPITVNLIGAGGTGSQVLSCLVRMDMALTGLGHPGLFVTVYDPDEVTTANIGRQLFSPADVGLNKAVCLVTRANAAFGLNWEAKSERFPANIKNATERSLANIYMTCTDNIASRFELAGYLKGVGLVIQNITRLNHTTPLYWMDFGNSQNKGQVIIGTIPDNIEQSVQDGEEVIKYLTWVTDYPGYNQIKDDDSGPSCSLAEALEKQDLFVNSILAQTGCDLLWKMLRHGESEYCGVYMNLETMKTNPIPV